MEQTSTMKWMWVAIGVLAIATIGFAIWAFAAQSQVNSLDQEKNAAEQTVAQEGQSIDSANQSIGDLQKQEGEIKNKFDKAEKDLTVDKASIKDKEAEINQLHQQLGQQQQQATDEENSLKSQLATSQTQEKLASACASLMIRGMKAIYHAPANANVMLEIADLLSRTAKQCKAYVG
ncbi:MAG: hypothetical protein KDC39_04555 [Actinobacteria bacterium]|nr:hypothetical protein [Actinomycetota bacterium]